MGSASREALAHAQVTLTSMGKKVTGSVAAELLTASSVIGGSSSLRAGIADNVVDPKVKQKLVATVFAKTGQPTRAVLNDIASSRWSHPDDVTDAVEQLGVRAAAMSSSTPLDEELLAINEVISSDGELELALGSKLGDASVKAALASKVFGKRVSEAAQRVLVHLVSNARGRRIGAMLNSAATLAADQAGFDLATVTVAQSLSSAQTMQLEKTLAQSYGRPVKLNIRMDSAVVGGMRIQIGDDVIDGSVASRLNELRLKLAS